MRHLWATFYLAQKMGQKLGRGALLLKPLPWGALVEQSEDGMKKVKGLTPAQVSDIIQMALSDHVSFANIRFEYEIAEKDVKTLMRNELKAGSYRTWRKRVRNFSDRRESYK